MPTTAPSLALPGAVPADPPDELVAGHYGDPSGEQRAWGSTPSVVDRSHLGVVVVDGPDRLTWLHALTSQALDRLAPHTPTELLVLSPQGHVEHHASAVDDGVRTWLVVEPAAAPSLVDFLDRMRFMSRVEVVDASDRYAVLTVRNLVDVPAPDSGVLIARRWPVGGGPTDLVVPRAALAVTWDRLVAGGARPVGHLAYEASRIDAGQARFGLDTDHRTLAHEVGWIGVAVHLDKGCYRGQETVARVHNLGRPPRRLVLVHIDGSGHVLPARGSELLQDGRVVGRLTSVAMHAESGPIGLALLRQAVRLGAQLTTADGIAVAVEADVSSPTEPVDLSGLRG